MAVSAYFIKPWAEKKVSDITAKIDGTQNQVNAISGQVGQLNQNVKNLSQKQMVKAEKAIALLQGDYNTTNQTQNITETKPDFRQDSEYSNAVADRLQEGLKLRGWINSCDPAMTERQVADAFSNWYQATHESLLKISKKAASTFAATDTNVNLGIKMSCETYNEVKFRQNQVLEKYIASLREIIKGL